MTKEKESSYSHDGYVKVVYNPCDDSKAIRFNTKRYIKEPLMNFRWFVKSSGEKVLQQAYNITDDILKPSKIEWYDIETVYENNIKE